MAVSVASGSTDTVVPTYAEVGAFPREVVLVASGSSTTSYASTDAPAVQVGCQGAKGLAVVLNASDISGGGGVAVVIQGFDPSTPSRPWYNICSGALVTATGYTVTQVNPDITAVANVAVSQALPSRCRITFTGANTRTTLNYSASLILTG